jgi:hypothetical protein
MTAEKLYALLANCTRTNTRDDLLLEEQAFVGGICLDVLLESLVLYERVIRPKVVAGNR